VAGHATCAACRHPDARAIDAELRLGATGVAVAEKYGLSEAGVSRHRSKHLGKRSRTSARIATTAITSDPRADYGAQFDRCLKVYESAIRSGSLSVANGASREMRGILDSIARLNAEGTDTGRLHVCEGMVSVLSLVPREMTRALADKAIARLQGHAEPDLEVAEIPREGLTRDGLTQIRDMANLLLGQSTLWKKDGSFRGLTPSSN
jgi:hypothetical protein